MNTHLLKTIIFAIALWGMQVSGTWAALVITVNEVVGDVVMKRILLVDDHEMARQALKFVLEHRGYACEEAEHGAAALAWLEQGQHVDLIVSDNQMPVMTGLEFLLQVKANQHFGTIPFILYSGNITDEIQRQAHQAGAIAVLNKPYKFSEFLSIVDQALATP